jgi:hypothetical protein
MSAIRSVPAVDGLLAATAFTDGPTLGTRKTAKRLVWAPAC